MPVRFDWSPNRPKVTKAGSSRCHQNLLIRSDRLGRSKGRWFNGTNLRKEWNKACASCGLGTLTEVEGRPYDPVYSGLTLHDLRRSAVRNLRKAGVSEKEAMRISGHKTRAVFDRYNIVSTDDVMDAMRKLELAALNDRKPVHGEVKPAQSVSKKLGKSVMALSSNG